MASNAECHRRMYQKRRDAGECVRCGKPSVHPTCDDCRVRRRQPGPRHRDGGILVEDWPEHLAPRATRRLPDGTEALVTWPVLVRSRGVIGGALGEDCPRRTVRA